MKIVLVLRDIQNKVGTLDLKFKVLDHALATHWLDLFKENILLSNHPIEKTYCLMNWQTSWDGDYSRNLVYLCDRLNQSIKIINENMNPIGYPEITLKFSVKALREHHQILLNDIHHHFEILIGQLWNESDWYKKTPNERTRTAIRMLNNYCHEIEGILRTIEMNPIVHASQQKCIDMHHPLSIHLNLNGIDKDGKYFTNKKLHYLTVDEFNCFQTEQEWGDVRIYYAQLGKTHMEAFHDKDEFIDRQNISSYQTLTGEAVFSLDCKQGRISPDFVNWCLQHDFDLSDKTLGIGYPIVAKIENQFLTRSKLAEELRLRNDISSVRLEDDNGNVILSRSFEYYTWQEEERWKDEDIFRHG
jgi:hypothetical protein